MKNTCAKRGARVASGSSIWDIPYQLIGELAAKMTPKDWITRYEKALKK